MVSTFQILQPPQIPTPASVKDAIDPAIRFRLFSLGEKSRWSTNVAAAEALLDVLSSLHFEHVNSPAFGERQPESRDDNVHDEYFGIERSHGPAPEVFVQAILRANWILFEDSWNSPFSITSTKLNILDSALNKLLLWILGATAAAQSSAAPRVINWLCNSGPHHSMTRWVRGHQIFAALTQGLTAAFTDLKVALQERDDIRVSVAVDLAVLLLNGSAVSLEFTGDFPSSDYTEIIRPSMTPPLVPDTFSGLLSVDHRFFIQLLREMKPLLDSMAENRPDHHSRIAAAVAAVYDSHSFVCDRLVGKCPSLMMASGSKKSGAEQIEKFKHLRLKVFQPGMPSEAAYSHAHQGEKVH